MEDGEGMGQLSRAKAGGRGPETRERGKVSGGIGGQMGMRRRFSGQQGARRGQLAAQPGGQAWPTGTLGDSCSDLCPGTKAVVWSAWRLLASLPLPCPFPALLFTAVLLTVVPPAQLHLRVCSLESAWTLTTSRLERSKVLLSSIDANVSACSLGFALLTFGIPLLPSPHPFPGHS